MKTKTNTENQTESAPAVEVHPLVRRLRAETVLGCPTICEEEWECIESIIRDEMHLPSDLLDVNAIFDQRDRLLAENVILRHGLMLIADDKGNPEGWASDKQIADHYLKRADAEKSNDQN